MNANPFTLGHLHLVERACGENDRVHLFIVSEEAGPIPAAVRKRLVLEGTTHLKNLVCHDTGPYLVSTATFPSYFQRDEAAVIHSHAGLDAAIGDYVYAFDTTDAPYPPELIFSAYQTALAGNDIVSVCPDMTSGSSRLFYRVFNANSHSAYALRTDAFRLVTRRAVNRVHASSEHLPYRKAAYAASGLKMADLTFSGRIVDKAAGRFSLAADSLALYTDAGFKASVGIALVMMALALVELVYTLVVFCTGHPVAGWTTTMFVLTVGFAGVFAVLAIVVKYLSHLVELIFKKQKYLIESVEKIQK